MYDILPNISVKMDYFNRWFRECYISTGFQWLFHEPIFDSVCGADVFSNVK